MMQSSGAKPKRPVGVAIIAVVVAAGGLLSLYGGASVLAGNATGPFAIALIVVIFGILGLALGAGFYTGARWAWMTGIVIYIVSIGLEIAEILYGGSVGYVSGTIRILAGIINQVYLTRQKPRNFLGKIRTPP